MDATELMNKMPSKSEAAKILATAILIDLIPDCMANIMLYHDLQKKHLFEGHEASVARVSC